MVLAKRPGRVWSRSQLLDTVWGIDYEGDFRIVDSYIKRLRQKLYSTNATGNKLDKSQFICTTPGIGYSFTDSKDTFWYVSGESLDTESQAKITFVSPEYDAFGN